MRRLVLVVCAGCGRLGFDATNDPTDDAAVRLDAARPDAPPNSLTMTFTAIADTYVSSDPIDVGNNFGADDRLRAKEAEERSLVRFDVSQLPASATVFSVDLQIVPEAESGEERGGTFRVHPALEQWTEGSFEGAPGVSNWTMRTATNAWTSVGAASPGSAGPMLTSFSSDGIAALSIALPPMIVETWVDQPSTNFGVVVMAAGQNDELRFSSREAIAALRPKLVVTYLP